MRTLTSDKNKDYQQQADPELPVLRRQLRNEILDELVDKRTDQSTVQIARSPDHKDHEAIRRALKRNGIQRNELLCLCQDRACDSCVRAGDGVNRHKTWIDRNTN